jgi:hypothetical protein
LNQVVKLVIIFLPVSSRAVISRARHLQVSEAGAALGVGKRIGVDLGVFCRQLRYDNQGVPYAILVLEQTLSLRYDGEAGVLGREQANRQPVMLPFGYHRGSASNKDRRE